MLTCIKGIGEIRKQKFNELGIFTPYDLIFTQPKSYIDLSKTLSIETAIDGCFCKTDCIITKVLPSRKKGKLQVFKAEGQSQSSKVFFVWFNQNYVSKIIEENEIYTFYGKICIDENGAYQFINPAFERKTEEGSIFQGIQPIYRTKGIMSQKLFADSVKAAIGMNFDLDSFIDVENEQKHNIMSYRGAIVEMHMPTSLENIEKVKERIVIEKLVKRLAAFRLEKKAQLDKKRKYVANKIDLKKVFDRLDFELNVSQQATINLIIKKITSNEKLNGMLCGDVGSGKTIIAFIACYFVAKNGYQSAIMAPTEILATQHYNKAKQLFEPLGLKIAMLCSSTKKEEREETLTSLKEGKINILIGTHSILNKEVIFDKLAFVVVDEQQRFGVAQRTILSEKVTNCDVLTLTATPIPRSLQLVAYGEIDFFTIEKRYEDNISTHIIGDEKRNEMFHFIGQECKKGRQAFIIAPMIEDGEGCESVSVKALYKELSKDIFKDIKIEILHGKLKDSQKQDIMDNFHRGLLQVIISTTIIEVGIDVPNVPIMVIMSAERFGLSTLHQLRGRIGRGGERAYCFLYTDNVRNERLQKFKACNNGMEIAEFDYAYRGSGDIFGTEQSGKEGLEGICIEYIEIAKDIVSGMDLDNFKKKLGGEIERNNLCNVSMT